MGVNEETGEAGKSVIDKPVVLLFKGLLSIFKMVEGYSPVDALSTGRSIEWLTVASAFGQIVLVLGGAVALFGIAMFTRRELAATNAQS